MRVVTTVEAMQGLAGNWRRMGRRIGFVPTMGYLHEGHMSLVKRARRLVGKQGRVVVSIYVNPTQFGPREDLAKYPRDLPKDRRLCRAGRVDVLFVPNDSQMYPPADGAGFSTYVVEGSLSQRMEGASRPTHFRGVATIVAKLFNIVQPEVAVFGAKDWQQAAVVQRMALDLNFPVTIDVAPTVREADGLALSSRNKYLSPEERAQATVLSQAIQHARQAVRMARRPIAAARLKPKLQRLIESQPAARVDYIEFFASETLKPLTQVHAGAHMALAVFIGRTRLIDNARLA
ncbi:MAG: pantoate--beta-alanine ligase [Pedosphaera parvula]|nr:pantoate--beta-alanine ligase [Pedosphaera parvula]